MGVVAGIDADNFPRQGHRQGRRVNVCFKKHDVSRTIGGRIVRDDAEQPYETIIALDDGRYVRGTECQYSFKD